MEIKITQEIKDKCIWYGERFRELSKGEHMKVLRATKLKNWQDYNLKKWIAVDDLHKRLSTVMNVRNNEKDMRLLIIEIQRAYTQY